MIRIDASRPWPLFGAEATRRLEAQAAAQLPPHTLMDRAGRATARLVMALAPHASRIWIACGPGNNGGDGLAAAACLRRAGFDACVTLEADLARQPSDARHAWQAARDAGVPILHEAPDDADCCVDALLGLGARRAPSGRMADWLRRMHASAAPLLSVDLPSALDADTGLSAMDLPPAPAGALRATLSLLTLKPGLFTADGRDAAGEVWFDDLGAAQPPATQPSAWLPGEPASVGGRRLHATHKGSFGDVVVVGGAPGMHGAALLAATAAAAGGAGRVFVVPLDPRAASYSPVHPQLMFRSLDDFDLQARTVVCGCGGGAAVAGVLPRVVREAQRLVLDADALNAIADSNALRLALQARTQHGAPTVVTPHPLEAARLLRCTTREVQSDRLSAARRLALELNCTAVLKGSGTVVDDGRSPAAINPTGNARLATAGTGDVLAGMLGARLAQEADAPRAARDAVWRHGDLADRWPVDEPLTADALARGTPAGGWRTTRA